MRGTSIIELIIYAAILVIMVIVIVQSLIVVQSVVARIQITRTLNTAGELTMQRMLREIRLAYGIDTAASTFDVHPGILKIRTFISAADSTKTTATISLSGGVLQFQREGQAAEILSQAPVTVTAIVFRNIAQGVNSKAVKIELGLEATRGTISASSTFYATAILKNSY